MTAILPSNVVIKGGIAYILVGFVLFFFLQVLGGSCPTPSTQTIMLDPNVGLPRPVLVPDFSKVDSPLLCKLKLAKQNLTSSDFWDSVLLWPVAVLGEFGDYD